VAERRSKRAVSTACGVEGIAWPLANAGMTFSGASWRVTQAYIFLAVAIAANAAGHLLLKGGAMAGSDMLRALLNVKTILGVGALGGSAVVYVAALRTLPLTVAMPSLVAGFLMTALIAHLVWDEPFGLRQLAAFGFIGVGLYLLHR
jgi:small multidrug resistance pump